MRIRKRFICAVTITAEFVCRHSITGCLLSKEQFLSMDSLERYLELYTERIHRGFGLVALVTTSGVYTKFLALPYFKLEIF